MHMILRRSSRLFSLPAEVIRALIDKVLYNLYLLHALAYFLLARDWPLLLWYRLLVTLALFYGYRAVL